ncbi:MAG: hypothetical protein AAF721_41475, partial [Myxococcota bacterium]
MIGLEVDHGPRAFYEERQVDHAIHQGTVIRNQRDRGLPATATVGIGLTRSFEQRVAKGPLDDVHGCVHLVLRRTQDATLKFGHLPRRLDIGRQRNAGEHGVDERTEASAPGTFGLDRQLDQLHILARLGFTSRCRFRSGSQLDRGRGRSLQHAGAIRGPVLVTATIFGNELLVGLLLNDIVGLHPVKRRNVEGLLQRQLQQQRQQQRQRQ